MPSLSVCEKCHDTDMNAISCNVTFEKHSTIKYFHYCEICGKWASLVPCKKYKKKIAKGKSCDNCIFFPTCDRCKRSHFNFTETSSDCVTFVTYEI